MNMPQYILVDNEEMKIDSKHDNYYSAKAEQESAKQDGIELSIYQLSI